MGPAAGVIETAYRVELAEHAVVRFNERVRPGLAREAAEDELVRLLELYGVVLEARPRWLAEAAVHVDAHYWLALPSIDLAFPVVDDVIVTTLTRGGYRPGQRIHVTRAKRQSKGARRAREDPVARRRLGKEQKGQKVRERDDWEAAA